MDTEASEEEEPAVPPEVSLAADAVPEVEAVAKPVKKATLLDHGFPDIHQNSREAEAAAAETP